MISLVKTSVRYDAQLAVVLCLNSDIPSIIRAERESIESIWKAVKVVVERSTSKVSNFLVIRKLVIPRPSPN